MQFRGTEVLLVWLGEVVMNLDFGLGEFYSTLCLTFVAKPYCNVSKFVKLNLLQLSKLHPSCNTDQGV